MIQVTNLSKKYNGRKALDQVSAEFLMERYMLFWVRMDREKRHL